MVQIEIDEELKNLAIEHSRERMKYEYNRFGFDNRRRENMILVGTLGQLVFKQFLDLNQIPYDYQLQAGEYDDFDFIVGNDIFEIKTSGYYDVFNKLNLLYSEDQYSAGIHKGFKYCIQIFVDGLDLNSRLLDISKTTHAVIAGYIEFDNIKYYRQQRRYYGDDYKIPVHELKDIIDLFGGN